MTPADIDPLARTILFPTWRDVAADRWNWPNFSPEEMACRGDGSLTIDVGFMDRLQSLRERVGFALPVTSGYRSPAHDRAVGGAGVHPSGQAADIQIAGADAWRLLEVAFTLHFAGIGVHQRGPYRDRFIHIDDLKSEDHPRPRIWSYK